MHPDAKREAEEASRKLVTAAEGGLGAFCAALVGGERTEDIPVRVGLGGGDAECSSLLTRSALRAKWLVNPLEPDWMVSALVSEIEVSLTVDGEGARAELRFELIRSWPAPDGSWRNVAMAVSAEG